MNGELPNLIFGCGYLGRRVAGLWRQQGRQVVAVTRSESRAGQFAAEGLVPYVADICEARSLAALPDTDRVLFAVAYDRTSGRTQQEVTVDGLKNVLSRIGARCRRFILVSSTSVYGQSDGSWVDEQSQTEPTQPGGICCLAGEELVRSQFANAAGEAIILRFAGIYGPNRLLSRIADLQAGRELPGDPAAWLNLIHADDGATAVIAASDAAVVPPVVLVADDQPVMRDEYYARLANLVGGPPPKFDLEQARARGSGGLNKRCSNRLMRESLAVALRFPSYESGLPAAVAGASPL